MRVSQIALSVVVGGLVVLSGAAAAGGAAPAAAVPPPSTIHGVNFRIETQVDNNFCVEADSGTLPGRTLTLQQCGVADNQRFALTAEASGLNELLDSQGMCLDVSAQQRGDGVPVPVMLCNHTRAQVLSYTGTGLLQYGKGCLQVPGAAANAPITLAKCDVSKPNQRWLVTH